MNFFYQDSAETGRVVLRWYMMQDKKGVNKLESGRSGSLSIVLAVGITGVLGIIMAHLIKQQTIIQKKTEVYFELNNLSNKILRSLYDGDGCIKTLGLGADMIDGQSLKAIKDRNGKVVVDTTQTYGNQLLKIDSINIANVNIARTGGQLDLQVFFKKLGQSIKEYGKTFQSYPLSVEDLSNVITIMGILFLSRSRGFVTVWGGILTQPLKSALWKNSLGKCRLKLAKIWVQLLTVPARLVSSTILSERSGKKVARV